MPRNTAAKLIRPGENTLSRLYFTVNLRISPYFTCLNSPTAGISSAPFARDAGLIRLLGGETVGEEGEVVRVHAVKCLPTDNCLRVVRVACRDAR